MLCSTTKRSIELGPFWKFWLGGRERGTYYADDVGDYLDGYEGHFVWELWGKLSVFSGAREKKLLKLLSTYKSSRHCIYGPKKLLPTTTDEHRTPVRGSFT